MAVGVIVGRQQPSAACCPGERPWLGLGLGIALEASGSLEGLLAAAEAEVELDEFRPGRQVDVADGTRAEHGLLLLEVAEGLRRVAVAELEIAQRGERPYLACAEAELAGQAERLSGVQAALAGPALPRFKPREARQGRRQLRALAGLAGEADRFMKAGLRFGPLVGGGLVDCHVRQHERQDADGGGAPGDVERSGGERPADV